MSVNSAITKSMNTVPHYCDVLVVLVCLTWLTSCVETQLQFTELKLLSCLGGSGA